MAALVAASAVDLAEASVGECQGERGMLWSMKWVSRRIFWHLLVAHLPAAGVEMRMKMLSQQLLLPFPRCVDSAEETTIALMKESTTRTDPLSSPQPCRPAVLDAHPRQRGGFAGPVKFGRVAGGMTLLRFMRPNQRPRYQSAGVPRP